MKAVDVKGYGKAKDMIEIKNVDKPIPKDNEILVRIEYVTVNRTDTEVLKANPFIVRLFYGFFKPKQSIFGREFAGRVEEAGKNVRGFKIGDEVFAYTGDDAGAQAEYICIDENQLVELKPENMTLKEASAVLDGMILANNYVKEIKGENLKVMVYGASGSIGSAALQLLKARDIEVTAVCDEKGIETVGKLGADRIIDYMKEDVWKVEERFDYIIDAVGKSSFSKCRHLLKEKGIYFSTELGFWGSNIFYSLITPMFRGRKVMFPIPKYEKKDINFFKGLIEEGKYKAVIDREYSLDEVIEAYEYVDSGHKTGNVVVKMEKIV